ncbi:MAG TPA: VWA domain-containing protein [Bacteroidia bacterium]|nr:VWA domain-containing protein [Bacteroidia bacterium]HNU34639.1 VWA domain-containing protein [Bacteroidia bacterium]
MFNDIHFAHPYFFWLLLLIPFMLLWHFKVNLKRRADVRISSMLPFQNYRKTLRQQISWLPLVARMLTVVFAVFALARPQSSSKGKNVTTEGISIMLALDISDSMLAEDLKPNRIEAAKDVVIDFVENRPNDLIGLVVFSGESFSQCPLTSDHAVLKNLLKDVKSGMLAQGTAIGEGLATAVARVKDAKTKSKVIILLSDGVNNAGSVAPLTAGEIAKTFGIRVYTVGVGTKGMAPYPFRTPFGIQYQNMEVQIDEDVMRQISAGTDAKYFRATGNKTLKEVYKEIDKMERTKIEVTEFKRYSEEYLMFALAAGFFLLLEISLRYTILRSIP